jgi:phage shock protein PspC (stress-responsive transcriptional regulator)
MSTSADHLMQAYIEQILKIQQEQKPLNATELDKIAQELGIDDEEMEMIRKRFNDFLIRGEGYSRYEDWESAIEELEQAVMLNPLHTQALFGLANALKNRYLSRKNKDDLHLAKQYAKRVVVLDPSHEAAIKLISELNRGTARYEKAKSDQRPVFDFKEQFSNIDIKNIKVSKVLSGLEDSLQKIQGKRLKRSISDKKIAGVCGGIAEYFAIDPAIVRVIFVIGTFMSSGSLLLVYFILAYVLPKK